MRNFFRPAAIIGTLPNTLTNGTTADATQVMADFNKILNDVNANAAPLSNTALLNATNTFTAVQVGVNATASANFPTAGQVQGNMSFGSDVGSANSYVINPTPAISAYADGQPFYTVVQHMNGTSATLSVSGLAARTIVNPDGTSLGSAAIPTGSALAVISDNTNSKFVMMAPYVSNGEYRSVQVFSVAGTVTYTAPRGLKRARIIVLAGGGAGGGAAATGGATRSAGGGGGSAGASIKTVSAATIGATQTVTVGAGGTGVAGGTGNTGGTSSFGAIVTATGGVGGTAAGAATNTNALPGAGGAGSSGDVNITGQVGAMGLASNTFGLAYGGVGAPSIFSGGGNAGNGTSSGGAATSFGAGGGGASAAESQGTQTGGAGSAGIVIVEEFF